MRRNERDMPGDLTQDFDAHVPFSFIAIPDAPFWSNRNARVRRWFFVAFAESWLAVFLFRLKVRLRASHVPVVPSLCDTLSRTLFGVSIGNAVEIGPGLMMTHGNVVIDGRTRIGKHCQINPWVTIGLSNSRKLGFSAQGPTIGDEVHIGTGAKILGPVTVGHHARIGANAVVIHDVPANTTVVGAPARVVGGDSGRATARTDAERLAEMGRAIVDFKLRRRSLSSLLEIVEEGFNSGSPAMWSIHERARDGLMSLSHVNGDDADAPSVASAIAVIEAAIDGR